MIKLVKSNPPIFEFELLRESQLVVVKLKALYWFQNYVYESDRQEQLQTSIDRFATCRSFDQWLGYFDYQQLDEWPAEFKKLVGNDEGLISRKDLLNFYNINSSALSYRIDNLSHPKPIRIGKKHWFNVDECDQWITSMK